MGSPGRSRLEGDREITERDVEDEVEFYLEMRTAELMEEGLSREVARRRAERAFGDRARHQAAAAHYARRRVRRRRWEGKMEELAMDLRYAIRMLRRRPGFAAMAILTLALGIGGATAMYTVIHSVLLEPLPYPSPDRLVRVYETNSRSSRRSFAPANYLDARTGASGFAHLAAFRSTSLNLLGEGEPERLSVSTVSSNFFEAMGTRALLGRTFDETVAMPGEPRVVVLSHGLWIRRFGADPAITERPIRLDTETALVVGVMPEAYKFPADTDLWMKALRDVPEFGTDPSADHTLERSAWYFSVVGRLADGRSITAVESELDVIAGRIREADPESNRETGFNVVPLHEQTVASARQTLWTLFGAVAFVLLIACTNVVNLLLVRAIGQRREMAIRAALGAASGRIVRHVFAETAVLSLLGGIGGLALGAVAVRVLQATSALPRASEIALDTNVFTFVAVLTAAIVIAVGALPGLISGRAAPGKALNARDGVGAGCGPTRLRSSLVIVEVALAVVLVLGAGLMLRSLGQMAEVDLGVETEGLATLRFSLPGARMMEPEEWRSVYAQMLDRVRQVPGVEQAGLASASPLSPGWFAGLRIQGRTYDSNNPPISGWQLITPGVLRSAGIELRAGRPFDASDDAASDGVAIVNEALASRMFPNGRAIGQRINTGLDGPGNYVRIVGVAADTRNQGPAEDVAMAYYRPFDQAVTFPGQGVVLTVRAPSGPADVVRPVQEAIWSVNADVPFYRVEVEDQLGSGFGSPLRFVLSLLGAFAACAVILGCVGIYGVMAYSVRRRIPEFGVRLALGARRGQVGRLVLSHGVLLAVVGIVLGSLTALALTRLLQGVLFGVSPWDPLTFGSVAVGSVVAAVLASLAPAWRAGRVDPVTAMRVD